MIDSTKSALKHLRTSQFLKEQIDISHSEVRKNLESISIMRNATTAGEKLNELNEKVQYWKGRRDTLIELQKLRDNKELF